MKYNVYMINKKIHYVWVGGNEMPSEVVNIIENNKKVLGKSWTTKIWTEKDFDIESHPFTSYWYKKGNWAYVSDYIRAFAVYKEGGFYIDTDIEIKKTFDPLTNNDVILSYTDGKWLTASSFGAKKGSEIIKEYMDVYDNKYVKTHQRKIMSSDVMTFVASKHEDVKILDPKMLQLDIDGNGFAIHHHHDNWKGKKTELNKTKYYTKKIENYKNGINNDKVVARKIKFITRKIAK